MLLHGLSYILDVIILIIKHEVYRVICFIEIVAVEILTRKRRKWERYLCIRVLYNPRILTAYKVYYLVCHKVSGHPKSIILKNVTDIS